ncbi:MAG TPA: putative toxin-antitoxin system toxin component, PIN family [Gemmataceae bacterium]|nr:putative toxin-antitoxin system toxin component, PIN family [Gemmataceae bacterium]
MRVVPDTNVLARAARRGTLAARVIAQLLSAPHLLILSPALVAEMTRVLRYPWLRAMHGLDDPGIDTYVSQLQAAALVLSVGPGDIVPVVANDPDDDWVVATAVVGAAEVICTRDTDFDPPAVRAYCQQHGIRILTDLELLNLLAAPPGP